MAKADELDLVYLAGLIVLTVVLFFLTPGLPEELVTAALVGDYIINRKKRVKKIWKWRF